MNRGIDHLVLCVRDLDAARAFYRRLGFTLTPKALHPWGTGNSLAQLRGSFLEILAVAEPAKIARPAPGGFSFGWFNASFLKKREGFSMLVLQTQDAAADHRAFAAAGLEAFPPFHFERQARLPDGAQATVAFTTAFVADKRMPEAGFFTCQQHAPQHFWKPEYQRHDNGALGVTEAVMRAPDPAAFAGFFAGMQGKDAVQASPGRIEARAGEGKITLLDPAGVASRYPGMAFAGPADSPVFVGYRVKVADLAAAAALLKKNAVPHLRRGQVLTVGPREAFGAAVEFAEA
jgi:catechol 2,3-dioxygenase-like lactoylglutathione lyase family enzyme